MVSVSQMEGTMRRDGSPGVQPTGVRGEEDIANLVEAAAPKPGKGGPYKKRPPQISN